MQRAPPPSDPELVRRIEKLAEWARTRGKSFEDVMRQKQGDSAMFSFLDRSGHGHDYYVMCRDAARVEMQGSPEPPIGLQQVGSMASAVHAMRQAGALPTGYCAIDLAPNAAAPPPIERGRLDARLAEFYEGVERDREELLDRQVGARHGGGRGRSRSRSRSRSRERSRRGRSRSRSRERGDRERDDRRRR
jgi:hypothetical protein